MPKCCLYCRVDGASTESNRLAMNQQLTALRSLAGQLGFSISAEMLQYESGLDANRQSIRTLIRDARHGVYDRVLVMNGDRLARDAEGLAAIGEKLTAAGVRVLLPRWRKSIWPPPILMVISVWQQWNRPCDWEKFPSHLSSTAKENAV